MGPALPSTPHRFFAEKSREEEIRQAVDDQARMSWLIKQYHNFGHEIAKTSPLKNIKSTFATSFRTLKESPSSFNYVLQADLDRQVEYYGIKGTNIHTLKDQWSPREAADHLEQIYCGPISFEYMHISSE
jgi:2-oxoglutarate dehydrogenase complex dehydrogenase (E1) component-like enzyme